VKFALFFEPLSSFKQQKMSGEEEENAAELKIGDGNHINISSYARNIFLFKIEHRPFVCQKDVFCFTVTLHFLVELKHD
jgi:hypothetical protein